MQTWWLDEIAHAGPEHLDDEYVAAYDRKAGFDPSCDIDVLRDHGLGPTSTVLDIGAGTGVFATAVAPHCGRVIAVDVSPAMTTTMQARVASLGLDNVTVLRAGVLSFTVEGAPDGTVDFVYSRNVLHHLSDFWKGIALARLAAVMAPGGVARIHDLIYDFDPRDAGAALASWFGGAVDDPAIGWTAGELAEHVRTEFSTYSWVFDGLLDRAGFDVVTRDFVRGVYGAYTCRRC